MQKHLNYVFLVDLVKARQNSVHCTCIKFLFCKVNSAKYINWPQKICLQYLVFR